MNDAFNQSFTLTKLSRKRLKNKKWITSALKKSSTVKNKLYKKWITSRNDEDESYINNTAKFSEKLLMLQKWHIIKKCLILKEILSENSGKI